MKKFMLLLCTMLIPVLAEYALVISKVEINTKKSNGKSWDAFGKPDLIISVYTWDGKEWQKKFTSAKFSNVLVVEKELETKVNVVVGDKIKFTIEDADLRNNDPVGLKELTITDEYITAGEINTSFASVKTFIAKLKEAPLSYKEKRLLQDMESFLSAADKTNDSSVAKKYLQQAQDKMTEMPTSRASHSAVKEYQQKIARLQAKIKVKKQRFSYQDSKKLENVKYFLEGAQKSNDADVIKKNLSMAENDLQALAKKHAQDEKVQALVKLFDELQSKVDELSRLQKIQQGLEEIAKLIDRGDMATAKQQAQSLANQYPQSEQIKEIVKALDTPVVKELTSREKRDLANLETIIANAKNIKDSDVLASSLKDAKRYVEDIKHRTDNERVQKALAEVEAQQQRLQSIIAAKDHDNTTVAPQNTEQPQELTYRQEKAVKNLKAALANTKRITDVDVLRSMLKNTSYYTGDIDSVRNHPQVKPLYEQIAALEKRIAAMENSAVKDNDNNSAAPQNTEQPQELTYRQEKAVKNLKAALANTKRITDVDVLRSMLKNTSYYTGDIDSVRNHPQVKPLYEQIAALEKRIAAMENSAVKDSDNNNAAPENTEQPQELTYRQKKAVDNLKAALANTGRVNDVDVLRSMLKNTSYYTGDIDSVRNHPQVKSLYEQIAALEKRISAMENSAQREQIDYVLGFVEKGLAATDAMLLLCKYKFNEDKILEMGKELEKESPSIKSSLKRAGRGGRHLDYAIDSVLSTLKDDVKKAIEIETSPYDPVYKTLLSHAEIAPKFSAMKSKLSDAAMRINDLSNERFADIEQTMQQRDQWNKGPRVFDEPLELYFQQNKKLALVLGGGAAVTPEIEKWCKNIDANSQKALEYKEFLGLCDSIRSITEKVQESFKQSQIAEAKKKAQGNAMLQQFLDYYITYADIYNEIDATLKQLKQDLLARIETASQKAATQGFDAFRDQYTSAKANRMDMLNNPEKYEGKIIANAKFPVASWNTKGWFLQHGNEMFSYVWDPQLWKRFREIELAEFKIFRDFRSGILQKYEMTKEGHIDWRYPGLVDIEFVAIVDGTTSYTPTREVLDSRGRVIWVEKLPPIQIVNARVVGVKSRYFTLWLGGTDTLKNLDTSGLPRK